MFCAAFAVWMFRSWQGSHAAFDLIAAIAFGIFAVALSFYLANLKRFLGNEQAAQKLARSGLARLRKVPPIYMGLDVQVLEKTLRQVADERTGFIPLVLTV